MAFRISLDDPEFFKKLNATRPDLFDQEAMAENIAKEKKNQSNPQVQSLKRDTNINPQKKLHGAYRATKIESLNPPNESLTDSTEREYGK